VEEPGSPSDVAFFSVMNAGRMKEETGPLLIRIMQNWPDFQQQ
jgi:hypothetical protein